MSSSDLEQQIANLSPAKKALLARRQSRSVTAPVLRRGEHQNGAPLSFTQQSIWLIQQLDPQSYLYNVPRVLRLTGKLDRDALEASLNEIIRRHEALRTTFPAESGEPIQVIAPKLRITLPLSEVPSDTHAPGEPAALNLALDEYRRPFDLRTGPLVRARLWKLSEHDHFLLLVMHHIVSDGWSGGVLFDELGVLYQAFSAGKPSPLPELPIQYADFAVWQRAWLERALEQHIDYWRNRLKGAPPRLELPGDRPRPQAASFRGHLGALRLAPELAERLTAFSQAQGATLFSTVLAALEVLLYRWTGQRDLVLGIVSANRNLAELEKLIGCFINFLALRECVQGAEQASDLLARGKTNVLEAYAHQDCPFEKVVEAVNPERVSNLNPLYNVALLVQNYPTFAFRGDQLEARFLSLDTQVAFLDLRFMVTESAGSILLECEGNAELFDRSTIDLLLAGYRDVLAQIIDQPSVKLDEVQIPDALARQAQHARSATGVQSIAVAATFTAELVERPLDFWMKRLGIPAKIQFAPFNQVFQQLLDPSSLLAANQHGFNLLLVRTEDLLAAEDLELADVGDRLRSAGEQLMNALRVAARSSPVPYLLCFCPPSPGIRENREMAQAVERAEASLATGLLDEPHISVVSSGQLLRWYPVSSFDDEYAFQVGHIPYTAPLFAALATIVARRLYAIASIPRQVIVVDCDQTLWKGNCQELETSGVEVDPPRQSLQQFLIMQQEAGMILCLCGKSAKESVEGGFAQTPNMRLGWQHIADSCFNQQPMGENLAELGRELGLDLETFVFVSANPVACAEVRAYCPHVAVAQLPGCGDEFPHFLSHFWAFDPRPRASGRQLAGLQSLELADIASQLSTVNAISAAVESQTAKPLTCPRAYTPARTPVEELLADIWARLLRVELPGIRDNFFALGGHSLLAVQVIARVRQILGVEMPLRAMFEAPTIAEFAARVEAARGHDPAIPKLQPGPRQGALPLSYAQQRLWFIDQLEPGNPLYNIPAMYRLRGKLHIPALEKTINQIVRRHESLRTTFCSIDGNPAALITPELQLPLPITLRRGLSVQEREVEIEQFARQQAIQPFDLSTGPLLRFSLLELAEDEHVLVVILHHIVGDGWSGSLLAAEMAALYEACVDNRPCPLPELKIQYPDFAVWQRHWMQGERLDRQLAYWRQSLADAPPVLELPTDHSRPAGQNHRGAIETRVIPPGLLDRVRDLSQAEGATLFMTLLAAFQLLLSRYSGQEDIVVGTTIAGRNYSEIEPLIGLFVNTLPLRTDLSKDPSFRELLARVKQASLDAYDHQEIPFEKLVEELQPERSLSYNPIFQVLFGLQNLPRTAFEVSGLKVERERLHPGTSMFDMSWFAFETVEGLLLRVEYDTDLFEAAAIARALSHYEQLLAGIVAHPEHRISELPLLTREERHQILVEFNDTAADYPQGFCIHDLVSRQAERTPDAVALIAGDLRLTYGELNQQANQLAHLLLKHGAGPEVLVAIYHERTPEMLIGILAILKTGSAYVPLDPAYPKDRVAHILEDARAPIVVTQQALVSELPAFIPAVICLDADRERIVRQSGENPVTAVRPENLAYVLFTSGSTGRPKGVALEHRSAATFVHWAQTVFTPPELAGVLFSTSVCFDLSVFEMFVPLSAGGAVIMVQNALHLPSAEARDQVTLINTVPSAMAELVRVGAVPESVKTINLAGEALPEALVNDIYSSTSVEKVYNLYGPTEDTTYSTYTLTRPNRAVTIGRPLPNTQAYVLDSHGSPQPIGIPGELHLAGAGLARGYYGRPDLTGERFLGDPFREGRDARMYRTGDLCRWLAQGELEYLGRLDHQIKLRGFRIELGEIEAVLGKHPSVRQCLVMAREDQPGLKRLVAYVVASGGLPASEAALGEHLKQSLPEFMLPGAFVLLEAFPLTPNGKINRKALPAPEYQKDNEKFLAPRTRTEEAIALIWSDLLRIPQVGALDDFFAIGGHSLLAAQVISRIRQAFRIELPLRTIFESSSLAGLAEQIDTLLRTRQRLKLPPLRRVSRDQILPLSAAQQSLWFLDQLDPDSAAYNIPSTHRLDSPLDLDILEGSVDALVARHESLRTTFVAHKGQPAQAIAPHLSIPVEMADFSHLPQEQSEQRALEWVLGAARRPFDLALGPLLRVSVAQLTGGAQLLSLCIHHIISDRWSMDVLLRDLMELYQAKMRGTEAALPPLPVQYADFAAWQKEIAQHERFREHIAYWAKELKGIPPVLELPTDRPRPAMETFAGDVVNVELTAELTDKLNALSRAHGATLFLTLLAAFQALMARYSGQDDLVLGVPFASRSHPEVENFIGLFASTLPIRARLADAPTFAEILQRVKDTLLDAHTHQDVPFEKLVEELQPERSLSHSPLVQVYFILQNAPVENLRLRDIELKHIPTYTGTAKGDLFFSLSERTGALSGVMEYKTDLFERSTVERMLSHYQVLLQAIVKNPNLRLSELPLLTEPERKLILGDWNTTDTDYPRHLCLHQLFEQQAERTRNAIALVMADQQITYCELNERANQLAHHLVERGVASETLVGIFLERSMDMVVALLGVLKAGGTYVPLDPAYPTDRIASIVDDSRLPVLLTQASLLAALPVSQATVINLDDPEHQVSKEKRDSVARDVRSENLAYVLYTSGSTGKPKGVQITHRNLVNFLLSVAKEPGLQREDTLLAVTTLSFDIAGLELYLPLITGARIILASRDEAADGRRLLGLIRHWKPTVMQATPATWRMLLDAGWEGTPTLKVLCGGEALPGDLAAQLLPRCGQLWNMYGPTETTIWSSVYAVTSACSTTPIGRPMANTSFYILDSGMQPLPVGVAGELYIGGEGVARGYFRRPELTAQRFVPDPFDHRPGARLYRTGDLARYLPDGNVQYLGRSDFQVKVRGFRIELGEIETVLAQHPAVQQVVVAAREDVPGHKHLVAYVVSRPDQHLNITQARAHLKQSLPDYMLPSAIVELDALPLTPNGKVDRKALPAPEYQRTESDAAFVAPRTPMEEIISSIWAEVLLLDRVGVYDNFFELGGHSLAGTQVVSRLREAFSVDLPLRALFEAPTVAGQAERVERLRGRGSEAGSVPLVPAQRNAPRPLSFAQQRLWFLDQLEPLNPLYNVPYIVRFQGPLKAGVLEDSLNEIVRRHESLRTRFEEGDGEPVQVVEEWRKLPLTIMDVSGLPVDVRLPEARRLAIEEVKRPFHLGTAPLVRALLIKLTDNDHALVVNTHHIITDRWSWGVLSQELAVLYEAFLEGKPSPLEELPLQYSDYATWQRNQMTESWMASQVAYWKKHLEGAPPRLELPTTRPRTALENFWGGICNRALPEDLGNDLRTLSRRHAVTPFMTLLASFQLLLAQLAGQDDIVVGTDLANRTQLATEKLIGFFVNLLPIRTRIRGDLTFRELLGQVKEASLGAFAHQDVPFEKLVEELRPERSLTHHPLVQVLFVMQNTPRGPREFGGLKTGPLGVSSTSRFDLVLFINNPDEIPLTTWMYNPNLFEDSAIARMAELYETLLRLIVAEPEARLSRIHHLLEEVERQMRQAEQKSFQETSLRKLRGARRKNAWAAVDQDTQHDR